MAINQTLRYATTLMNPKFRHILEFGVFKGKTVKQLRKTLDDYWLIYGFDSFIGLPEDWEGTDQTQNSFSRNGEIPDIPRVKFLKGWFTETIPVYLHEGEPIALLHVDCDLYSSTKTVLEQLNHLIVPSTVIVFDEWYYNHLDIPENRQHEQKAFYEWVATYQRSFQLLPPLEDERQIVLITESTSDPEYTEPHPESLPAY